MRSKLIIVACSTLLAFCTSAVAADILGDADARLAKYRTGDVVLRLMGPSGEPLPEGTHVKIVQTRHAFLFGANIFMLGRCRTAEENSAYAERFAAIFNYATLPFYWGMYEPEEGKPQYAETEKIVAWCENHQITMKGHPLAWNYVDPKWLPKDPDTAMRLQFDRIGKCVGRFKGAIDFWDVVNEATDYERSETADHAPILTEGIRRVGVVAYLQRAFREARAANPGATLLINDYETDRSFGDKVISRLVDDSGRPLYDVIGIQSHQHTHPWSPEKTWEVCERFAVFGKPLHFTETTFLSGQEGWELKKDNPQFNWVTTPEGERRQAELVTQFYTVLFSHPAVQAITWWDLTDQHAWQGAPAGLLRDDMSPKPAYDALLKLIKGKWWTRTQARVGSDGEVRFRGFFGEYRVEAQSAGHTLTGQFSFDKVTSGMLEVSLQESN
jgi:endo-1,4-beta-xylanase